MAAALRQSRAGTRRDDVGLLFAGLHAHERVLDTAHEYVSFIALVGSLFVVSGGIHIVVKSKATPLANVVFLLVGAALANVLGTDRRGDAADPPVDSRQSTPDSPHHIVFFIFLVANIGGCLTPIGDPPLFLGYLQGVPFGWVMENCWPMWLLAVGMLLAMFYVID